MMQITPEQYEKIAPCLPKQRGNVSLSNLQALNAILCVAEHGCKWRGLRVAPAAATGLPSCARVLSQRAVPSTPPRLPDIRPVAWPGSFSLRPMHKGSARGFSVSRLIWVHWCYGPPLRRRHAPLGPTTEPGELERPGHPRSPRRVLHAEQAISVEGSFHPSRLRAPWLGIRASHGSTICAPCLGAHEYELETRRSFCSTCNWPRRGTGSSRQAWAGSIAGVAEFGRRARLRILWGQPCPGSSPGPGTINHFNCFNSLCGAGG